ncbi:putative bifunctional diguanylate cyclase/phosphodiesterase [Aliagarivorans marinus]|uniref:putative bifunctional diguanylate cyclase/phosphodiesterase n=1 Tax=Aliagarivorans marinus TaxID=561965 RepID=UPI00042075D6|nr:EAL domain-containing protein [Aliagarivorans marinus]
MNIKKGLALGTTSIRRRILLSFALVLSLGITLVSVTTLNAAYRHTTSQLGTRLSVASTVFMLMIENEANSLNDALTIFAKDFNSKQLLDDARNDSASLTAALYNLQQRNRADFVVAYSADGERLAATADDIPSNLPAQLGSDGYGFIEVDGQAFLVEVAPYRFLEQSPNPNGWLVIGEALDRFLVTEQTRELIGLDLMVFAGEQAVASTSQPLLERALQLKVNDFAENSIGKVHLPEEHLIWRFSTDATITSGLQFAFVMPNDTAYLNFINLLDEFVLVLIVVAVLASVLTIYVANGISRPMRQLVSKAEGIQHGNYAGSFPTYKTTEVQSLSTALQSMQQGIVQREQEIHTLAYFDSLSGLPNRNAFVKHMADLIEQQPSRPFAVITLDLDRFKEINDTLGHDVGDKLLQRVAQRLTRFEYDNAYYAHIGEDEFMILLTDIASYRLKADVEQFCKMFDSAFDIDGVLIDIEAGFGVALYPENAQNTGGMMQCVDIALGHAKSTHHKIVYYRDELNQHSVQRLSLMTELRSAIERDELQLFYQPKLNIELGKVTKVECLVRWIHPEHGFVGPDDFIPLAEQSGAIRDLTKWVIRTALDQYLQWKAAGIELQLAVNISALDLVDNELPAYVSEELYNRSLSSSVLTFEVTESAIMAEPEQAMKALTLLNNMGIALSIDDFGTGYSSMGQLKQMPVSELKIDKSFVLNLASDKQDSILVKASVELAHNLGLSVVAEGVEDEASLQILKQYKVEFAQGYFISKPLNSSDFSDWIEQYHLIEGSDEEQRNAPITADSRTADSSTADASSASGRV